MKGRGRRQDRQMTGEAEKGMQDMGGRRSVSGVFNSMQPRGSGVYAGAFRRRRAGRTGALAAPTLALAMLGATPMARPQTSTLPVVTITADATEVREGERAEFTIRRTGATTAVLRGSLYVTGADASLTYAEGWAFAFRQGEASKGFGVTVLDDGTAAADREVTVLVDHRYPTYTQGTPGSATMTVIDTTPAAVIPPEPPEAFRLGVPSSTGDHLRALGDRARVEGSELTVYDGTWLNSSNNSVSVRLILQLPLLVRVEGVGGQGTVLAFDGSQVRAKAAVLLADEQLMETLVHDTQEGFLHAIAAGGFRIIGYGYGNGPNSTVKYDVFEVAVPAATAMGNPIRTKWFYFDSSSGLLARTVYEDGRGNTMESRFSAWGEVAGSYYPGRIERYEGSTRIFTFTSQTLSVAPLTGTAVFENPNTAFSLEGETP